MGTEAIVRKLDLESVNRMVLGTRSVLMVREARFNYKFETIAKYKGEMRIYICIEKRHRGEVWVEVIGPLTPERGAKSPP